MNPSTIPADVIFQLNLVPFAFLAILLICLKPAKLKTIHEDYLSLQTTKNLQGFSMLFIMFHHLVQLISSYGWFNIGFITVFNNLGLIFTGIFFFCSGFGLITSLEQKENYLKTFLIRRLPAIIIPFYTANTLYIYIVRYLWKSTRWPALRAHALEYPAQIFSGWKLYNNHLWFPIEICFIYLGFFIIFSILKGKKVRPIAMAVMSLYVVGLIVFSISRGRDFIELDDSWFYGHWWYTSTLLFIVGMYYAYYKAGITRFFARCYYIALPVVAAGTIGSIYLSSYLDYKFGYTPDRSIKILWKESTISMLGANLMAFMFALFMLLLSMKLKFNNIILRFLGTISFELYMTHNIVLYYFFNKCESEVNIQLIIYVYVASVVLATAVHYFNALILWAFRRLTNMLIKGKQATASV